MQNKILNSVSSQLIFIFISMLVGLALVPIVITMLGKIQYGAFELILSLIFIDTILEFGIGSALVKYIPEYKENILKLKSFVWSYFYLKNILTLIGFILILIIGLNFENIFNLHGINNIDDIKIAVVLFGIGLFLSSTSTFLDNFLKGFVYFGSSNLVRSISMILFFIVIYGYYKLTDIYNIVEIAFIWFIVKPLVLIVFQIVLFNYLNLNYIFKYEKFNYSYLKETKKFMFGMSYISIIGQIYNNLPKIILGIFMNPVSVAYWGVMEKIKGPLLQIENSMIRPLIPILSDKKNTSYMTEQKTFQAIRLQYFFVSFLGIMTITHIDLFIHLWLGEDFKEVSLIIQIIMVLFIFPKAGVLLMMYYSKGQTKINRVFVTIRTILSLTLGTLVLIFTEDLILYVSTIVLVSLIMAIYNISKYLSYFDFSKFKFIKDSIFLPFFVMILFYFIYKFLIVKLISYDLIGLLSSVFVSLIIYGILFFIFMKSEDKKIVSKILNRKKVL